MSQPLLGGGEQEYVDTRDDQIWNLKERLRLAEEEIRAKRDQIVSLETGLRELRSTLTPLYRSLRYVFGDLDKMGVAEAAAPSSMSSGAKGAWDKWKQKLPGFPSRMIDALLEHGELSVSQLVVAAQCPRKQTIYDAASKLGKLGLISQNNGKYSLKEL